MDAHPNVMTPGWRAKRTGFARGLILALALGIWTLALPLFANEEPAPPDQDSEVVREAFRETLYRVPSLEEIQAWKAAEDEGTPRQTLVDRLRGSEEYRNLRFHRKEEARDLVAAFLLLAVIYLTAYVTVVRGHRERLLLFAVFVFMFTPFVLDYDYVFQNSHFGDFPSFYFGADYIYNQGVSPYGTTLSTEVEEHIFPFFHPPPSMLVFYPWAHISYDTAIVMGIHGNFIALCLLLYLVVVKGREDSLIASICFLVYILCYNPVRLTLDYGQINLWTTVFISLFIYAYVARKHPAWMGLSLACAILLKIYPAGLLAYLVLKKQWKAIGWCLAGIGGCVVLAVATIPWPIWEAWWEAVGSKGSYGDAPLGLFTPGGPWNQGLQGLIVRIFTDSQFNVALFYSPVLSKVVTYTLALLILGSAGALIWLRDRRGLNDAEELELGLMLVVMVLVVPLSWAHHTVMIIPGIVAAARVLQSSTRKWLWVLFFISACVVAWDWRCFPQERFRLFYGGPTLLLGSIRVFGLIGLLITMLTLLFDPLRKARGEVEGAG